MLRKGGSSFPLLCGNLPVNGDPSTLCTPLHPTCATPSPGSAWMPGVDVASSGYGERHKVGLMEPDCRAPVFAGVRSVAGPLDKVFNQPLSPLPGL